LAIVVYSTLKNYIMTIKNNTIISKRD